MPGQGGPARWNVQARNETMLKQGAIQYSARISLLPNRFWNTNAQDKKRDEGAETRAKQSRDSVS